MLTPSYALPPAVRGLAVGLSGGSRVFVLVRGRVGGRYLPGAVRWVPVALVEARYRIRQEPGPAFVELGSPASPLASACFIVIVK